MSEEQSKLTLFEQTVLPHLDAAHNLARWILNNEQDAEDMVQEATLRAYKYFTSYHGANSRAWLLTIVRNTCYTWLHQNRNYELNISLDEELYDGASEVSNPELISLNRVDRQTVRRALEALPTEFRELIILREIEGLSYKEIAQIDGIPIGTVMSRLARARQHLKQNLTSSAGQEGQNES